MDRLPQVIEEKESQERTSARQERQLVPHHDKGGEGMEKRPHENQFIPPHNKTGEGIDTGQNKHESRSEFQRQNEKDETEKNDDNRNPRNLNFVPQTH